jgi:hypothetical protein
MRNNDHDQLLALVACLTSENLGDGHDGREGKVEVSVVTSSSI